MNTEAVWLFLGTQGVDFDLKILAALAACMFGVKLAGSTGKHRQPGRAWERPGALPAKLKRIYG